MRSEARPDGYPPEYETQVRLADGRVVSVRPILPSDSAELAEAIRSADSETLHRRFLGGPPRITARILDELTCLDYRTRFALVAREGTRPDGRGVAVARYAVLPSGTAGTDGTDGTDAWRSEDGAVTAEVAVAVAPDWRGVGLATELVRALARRARECGIASFTALFMAENRPVVELAHEAHARVVIADGAARLYAPIDGADI